MKKALLILALSAQAAFAGSAAETKKVVLKPVLLNGEMVYVRTSQEVVTRSGQTSVLAPTAKKQVKSKYADGLRRSLLRSNFR